MNNPTPSLGNQVVILQESNGNRKLPIVIGAFEAQCIIIALQNLPIKRPLTHDLFKSMAETFDLTLKEVLITKISEGTFYSRLIMCMKDGSNVHEIDARTSDAIAIGLRFGVPIFANNEVMNEAAYEDTEQEKSSEPVEEEKVIEVSLSSNPLELPKDSFKKHLGNTDMNTLDKLLQTALESEDYEKAALIRDEINQRKK